MEPIRYDDVVLSVLLLIIGVPRAVEAVVYDRSIGVEGTLSMICVVFALMILLYRNFGRRNAAQGEH